MNRVRFAFLALLQIAPIFHAKPSGEVVQMPRECRDKTFCFTKHKDYPTKIVENLTAGIGDLFENKEEDGVEYVIGDSFNDCETRVSVERIYEIIDQNGDVRFVVQTDDFRQFVRIEECLKPGRILGDTFNIHGIQLQRVKLSCVQSYMDYSFVVLSSDQKYMETVKIPGGVPISCNCVRDD